MNYNQLIKVIIIISVLSSVAGATAVTTGAATGIGTDTVTYHATVAGMAGTGTLWYEYGGLGFIFRTPNQSVGNGATSTTVTDMPIMAGTSYKYRAVVDDGVTGITTGNTVTFTISPVTTIDATDYNFTEHTYELIDVNLLDVTNVSSIVVKPYTDRLGAQTFWGIFFALIFGFIWLRQDDITLPSMLGILIGSSIWGLMDVQYVAMAQSLLVVSLAGLIFSIVRPRS